MPEGAEGQKGVPETQLQPETKQTIDYLSNRFLESVMGTDNETGKLDQSNITAQQMSEVLQHLALYFVPGETALPPKDAPGIGNEEMNRFGVMMKQLVGKAQERLVNDTHVVIANKNMISRVQK